jgi:hypothetical protein
MTDEHPDDGLTPIDQADDAMRDLLRRQQRTGDAEDEPLEDVRLQDAEEGDAAT